MKQRHDLESTSTHKNPEDEEAPPQTAKYDRLSPTQEYGMGQWSTLTSQNGSWVDDKTGEVLHLCKW